MIEEGPGQAGQHRLGRPVITAEVPAADVVAEPAQEGPQRHGTRIAGEQAGEDQHPVTVAARGGQQPGRRQQQRGQVSQAAEGLGQQQPGRWPGGRPPVIWIGGRGITGPFEPSPNEVHHCSLRSHGRENLGKVVIHT